MLFCCAKYTKSVVKILQLANTLQYEQAAYYVVGDGALDVPFSRATVLVVGWGLAPTDPSTSRNSKGDPEKAKPFWGEGEVSAIAE